VSKKFKQLSKIFYTLCNDFGFSSPTILQQQIPKFAAEYRLGVGNKYCNSIIESSEKDGNIIAGLLLHLLREQKENQEKPGKLSSKGPVRLLVADQTALELIEQIHTPESPNMRKYRSIGVVGTQQVAGEDLPELRANPHLLAATPDRLIDHLRRDNIDLRNVIDLVIIRPDIAVYPDMNEDEFSEILLSFNRDLHYIFSKFKRPPKTFIFSPNPEQDTSLIELMKRPQIFSRADWSDLKQILHVGNFPALYPELISEIIFNRQISGQILVFCETPSAKNKVQKELDKEALYFTGSTLLLTEKLPDIQEPSTVFFYGLCYSEGIQQIIPDIANNPQVHNYFYLTTSHKTNICQMLEEQFTMKNSLDKKSKPELIAAGKINMLLEKIRGDKNPEELQAFRKMIRKTVPFSMRMYLAAYLLRDVIGSLPGTGSRASGSTKVTRQTAANGDGSSLFISIGKSRRVYPKDLSRLLQESAGLESSDILSIKILDNYSFITVSEKRADQAIQELNGTKFRGRAITCDYARKKG